MNFSTNQQPSQSQFQQQAPAQQQQSQVEVSRQDLTIDNFNVAIQVDQPIQNFVLNGHNNQIVLKSVNPNAVLVDTCYIQGHNNYFQSQTDSQGNPAPGCDLDTLVVIGHNNTFDALRVQGQLVVQGHNNKFNGVECHNITDQGMNNKIVQYASSSDMMGQQQQQNRQHSFSQQFEFSTDEENEEEFEQDGGEAQGDSSDDEATMYQQQLQQAYLLQQQQEANAEDQEEEESSEEEMDPTVLAMLQQQEQQQQYASRSRQQPQQNSRPQQQANYAQAQNMQGPQQNINDMLNNLQNMLSSNGISSAQVNAAGGLNVDILSNLTNTLSAVQGINISLGQQMQQNSQPQFQQQPGQNGQQMFFNNQAGSMPLDFQQFINQVQEEQDFPDEDNAEDEYDEEEELDEDGHAIPSPEQIDQVINSIQPFKYEQKVKSQQQKDSQLNSRFKNLSMAGSSDKKHQESKRPETGRSTTSTKTENCTNTCSICLDGVKQGQNVKALGCSHIFHVKCIDTWLRQKLKCPTCRFRVL